MNSPNNTSILGGRLIDPASGIDSVTDIFIHNGKILAIGEPPEGFTAHHTIDASGRLSVPAWWT